MSTTTDNVLSDRVLVVLNAYSRPRNQEDMIQAWSSLTQTHPSIQIVLCNNRPYDIKEVYTLHPKADDIWRWTKNSGCPSHFYPALAYNPREFKYTIFADDDLLPGNRAVENLLRIARDLKDRFATIGQVGRNFLLNNLSNSRYSAKSVPHRHRTEPVPTHLTCRVHMIQTKYLPYIIAWRNRISEYSEKASRLAQIHDDFLMCMGIQAYSGFPSYVIPYAHPVYGTREDELIKTDLDDGKATWRKTGHFEDRNAMVDISVDCGWTPINPR